MVKIVFLFIFFGLFEFSNAQITVEPNNPVGTFPHRFVNHNLQGNGYYFLTTVKLFSTPLSPTYISPYPSIMDQKGYLVWYAKPSIVNLVDFKYIPSTDQYSFIKVVQNAGSQTSHLVLDNQLNFSEDFDAIGYKEDGHDLLKAQNGNWLYLVDMIDTVDLSAEVFDGQQGSSQTILHGVGIQERSSSGDVVFEWNPNDYVNPTDSYSDFFGYNPNNFDYCHSNALAEDTDGNLLLSLRHLNDIYKIKRQTGEIMWILGGVSSNFTFTNDMGFSAQHNIRVLGAHHYSLFDNGNMASPQLSRGLEITVDTMNWTASVNKEYTHPQSNYSPAMGSTHIKENGEAIIGYGRGFLPAPQMAHIDSQNNLLAELYFQDSVVSYRVNYSPSLSNLIRPQISCSFNGTAWELMAPAGHASYLWSSGETTQNIVITQQDTLQVFVPQGIGFISSEPVIVNPTSNPCALNILELNAGKGYGNFEWFSVLGQKIEAPRKNSINIKVWENGVIERIFVID